MNWIQKYNFYSNYIFESDSNGIYESDSNGISESD